MPDEPKPGGSRFCVGFKDALPANLRRIVSDVVLTPAHLSTEKVKPYEVECRGLWDTGAQASTIRNDLALELNLPKIGKKKMQGAGGPYDADVYLAGLILPNGVIIPSIQLTGFAGSEHFNMLLGMDVILRGDFLISAEGGTAHFSFNIPSWGGFYLHSIQSVKLHNGVYSYPGRIMQPAVKGRNRNERCPCGSGKKFKNCCGR